MNLAYLDSLEDSRLAPYRDLPQSNLTAASGRFIVEGKWLVERLVASQYAVESIVADEQRLSMVPAELPPTVPVYVLPTRGVEQLIGFNFHRGILACGRRRMALSFAEWLPSLRAQEVCVACVDIQDPTNLGGILRNCAAFGVAGVLLSSACADPFSRRVLRVSMGTALRLPILPTKRLLDDLRRLRDEQQFELVATVLDAAAEQLDRARRSPRLLLLIGNEGHGLPPDVIGASSRRVTLPMQLGTDSLNAAAASAVFLYHFTRVVGASDPPVPATSAG